MTACPELLVLTGAESVLAEELPVPVEELLPVPAEEPVCDSACALSAAASSAAILACSMASLASSSALDSAYVYSRVIST